MFPVETIVAACSVASTTIVGFGLWRTWRRNGSEQEKRDKEQSVRQALRDRDIELGYKAIVGRLDNRDHGLEALDTKITNIKTEYGETLARHDERLNALE